MKTIGQRLRHLRESQELTLRKLAEKSGVAFASISNIENGRRPSPSAVVIRKLAHALGVAMEELMK